MKALRAIILLCFVLSLATPISAASKKRIPLAAPSFDGHTDVIHCSTDSSASALKLVSGDRIEIGGFPLLAGPGGPLKRIVVRTTETEGSVEAAIFTGCTSCRGGIASFYPAFIGFTLLSSDITPRGSEKNIRIAWSFKHDDDYSVRGNFEAKSAVSKHIARLPIDVIRLRPGTHYSLVAANPNDERNIRILGEGDTLSGVISINDDILKQEEKSTFFLANTGTNTLHAAEPFDAIFILPLINGNSMAVGAIRTQSIDKSFLAPGMAADISILKSHIFEKKEVVINFTNGQLLRIKVN